jgi:hypothetical protein
MGVAVTTSRYTNASSAKAGAQSRRSQLESANPANTFRGYGAPAFAGEAA